MVQAFSPRIVDYSVLEGVSNAINQVGVMKALVINLDSATRRMDFQEQQLTQLGISFQRIAAVCVTKESAIYQQYYKTWQRLLSPPEVGCFLSHKDAWESVLQSGEPMLILEDDAFLTNDITGILEALSIQNGIDYTTLEITGTNKRKTVARQPAVELCNSRLFRLYQGRSGAGGYVLWPDGAKKLLKTFQKKEAMGLVDAYINTNYSLAAYQLEPAVVLQLDQCKFHGINNPIEAESSISVAIKPREKTVFCLRCRLRRVRAQVTVGWNRLIHTHHSEKRHIKLSDKFPKKEQ